MSAHMTVWAARWPLGSFVEAQRLHDDYEQWCIETGIPPVGVKARKPIWEALGFQRVRHGPGRRWRRYAEPAPVQHDGLFT